jgi:exodeoxyribonuclease-3
MSGSVFRNAFCRDAGLRVDHLLLSLPLAGRLVAAEVDRDVRGRAKLAITRLPGLNLRMQRARYRSDRSRRDR